MLIKPYSACCEGCIHRDVLTLLGGVWNVTCLAQIRIQGREIGIRSSNCPIFQRLFSIYLFLPLSILLSCDKQDEMCGTRYTVPSPLL